MTPTDTAKSASAFKAGADELGVFAQVSVDPKVFSDTAIFKTAYWLTDQYYVYFSRDNGTAGLLVEFRLKQGADLERLKTACGDFWNRLLDYQLREKILTETANVRDTLVRKAFFEAKAPLPAPVATNESLLPAPGAITAG